MQVAYSGAMLAPVMNDVWRRWVAENLMLDVRPDEIVQTLAAQGFALEVAVREVQSAMSSPYLTGARQGVDVLQNRLAKRQWVLEIYRKLNRQQAGEHGAQIARCHRLSGEAFFEQYYFRNRPVIITGMMDHWPAMQRWSYDYLREQCGEAQVEIQMGRGSDANYELNSLQHKSQVRFADYVDMVESAGSTNDFYMTANNSSRNKQALRALWQDVRLWPEYLDTQSPDDGFFWFGPAGIKTPFHHDLTNNFLAQIKGRKRVKLIPACELAYVYNNRHCYTPVDGSAPDLERFPLMAQAQMMECELQPGEILFLPVGCWHYVEGLDASISMSFINFRQDNDYSSFYQTYQAV